MQKYFLTIRIFLIALITNSTLISTSLSIYHHGGFVYEIKSKIKSTIINHYYQLKGNDNACREEIPQSF